MLTARPVIVQIMAADTPLAMLRASALPRSAIESNTSSMPETVPMRPSSGAIGTRTCITGKPVVIEPFKREIIDERICRAHHDVRSLRASHLDCSSAACFGSTIVKYQKRSMISAHISTPEAKIHGTQGPPSLDRSTTPLMIGICSSTALFLDAFRQHAGALLVEDLDDAARQRVEQRVGEQERDSDAQTEQRGDHGHAESVGHELRIARTRLRDALEGQDHADDRADQSEQRTCGDAQAQESLEPLELGNLAQHGLRDPQLGDVGVLLDLALVALEGEQHAPERVVRGRAIEVLQLTADPQANDHEVNQLEHERQEPKDPDGDDDVADRLAGIDALERRRP